MCFEPWCALNLDVLWTQMCFEPWYDSPDLEPQLLHPRATVRPWHPGSSSLQQGGVGCHCSTRIWLMSPWPTTMFYRQLSDMVHLKSTIAHTLNSTCNKERFSDKTVYSDSRQASFLSKTHLNFTNDRNQHIITSGQYCGRGLSGTFHTIILYINPRQKSSACLN